MRHFYAKGLLFGLASWLGAGTVLSRLGELGFSLSLLPYLALLGGLCLCLIIAAQVRSLSLRLIFALFFGIGTVLLNGVESTMKEALTYDGFVNMYESRGFISDALGQYGTEIVWALIAGLLLAAAIAWKPATLPALQRPALVMLPITALAALPVLLYARGGDGGTGLPGAFVTPAYHMVYAADKAFHQPGPRQGVAMVRAETDIARDIVLIVDESIAGQYLDINAAGGARSGLAGPRNGFTVHNFGLAAAITNCSLGSNLTLRHGGTRDNYRSLNSNGPAIWAYAKRAGMETVYLDGQRTDGSLQNGMDSAEKKQVDRFIQFDAVPVINRDLAIAERLAELVSDNRAQFIYVNKMGAHFPVHDKYPESHMRYQPASPRGNYHGVSELVARDVFTSSSENWRLYRNAYRNTLEWKVGGFFDAFFARAKAGSATLIYTSDHGQNLHSHNEPGSTTHCSQKGVVEEGVVPLVLMESGVASRDWEPVVAGAQNARSHYRIFPTLLALMGYDAAAISKTYGPGLESPERDPLTFNIRFNARLGASPAWKAINPQTIASPDPADYGRATLTKEPPMVKSAPTAGAR